MRQLAVLAFSIFMVLGASSAFAQPTLASNGQGGSGAGSLTATASLGTASAGDLVYCEVDWYFNNLSSVTDNLSNTYYPIGAQQEVPTTSIYGRRYYSILTTGGSLTVTSTFDATGSYSGLYCVRFNVVGAWAIDQQAVTTTGTASTSGSSGATSTRTSANQLLIGSGFTSLSNTAQTWVAGSNVSWTMAVSDGSSSDKILGFVEYATVSSAGTDAAEWSSDMSKATSTQVVSFTYSATSTNLAPHVVQSAICQNGFLETCAFSQNVTQGNLLLMFWGNRNLAYAGRSEPTDTVSSTWATLAACGVTSINVSLHYAIAAGSGANTLSFSPGGSNSTVVVAEVSGQTASSYFDDSDGACNDGNDNVPTGDLANTTFSHDLIVAGFRTTNTAAQTIGAPASWSSTAPGYRERESDEQMAFSSREVSSTGNYDGTFSTTNTPFWSWTSASIKGQTGVAGGGGGGGSAPRQILLVGVGQ